jgi:hypothetical protein
MKGRSTPYFSFKRASGRCKGAENAAEYIPEHSIEQDLF